jgi:hypothetical protein
MDAWLDDNDGPAVYVGSPAPDQAQIPIADGLYQAPGGPGLGEPDVLEAAGLGTWAAYEQMENDSPMHEAKQAILDRVETDLEDSFGSNVVVERAHHIKPMVAPAEEDLWRSTERLVEQDVDVIVDAYTSHLHSDIMNECMKEPAFRQALDHYGYEGQILEADPSGLTDVFAAGMADAIAETVRQQADPSEGVWVSLTHHGTDPGSDSPCKDRPEPYVEQSRAMFEATAERLEDELHPNATVAMVYGQGAEDSEAIYSPLQAAENASEAGYDHLVDVPYELPGDGYDNLVNHRNSYELDPREAPHYDDSYRTNLTRYGVDITITSSDVARETRADAQTAAILDAMNPLFDEET